MVTNTRPHAPVTAALVTGAWALTAHPSRNPGLAPRAHVPVQSSATPGVFISLCWAHLVLGEPATDVPPCGKCVERLAAHGLWPLVPPPPGLVLLAPPIAAR